MYSTEKAALSEYHGPHHLLLVNPLRRTILLLLDFYPSRLELVTFNGPIRAGRHFETYLNKESSNDANTTCLTSSAEEVVTSREFGSHFLRARRTNQKRVTRQDSVKGDVVSDNDDCSTFFESEEEKRNHRRGSSFQTNKQLQKSLFSAYQNI